MSRLEAFLWCQNIDRVRADELLRERGGELTAEQLHAAVLLATGDRKRAARERARRWLDERRGPGS